MKRMLDSGCPRTVWTEFSRFASQRWWGSFGNTDLAKHFLFFIENKENREEENSQLNRR